MITNFDEDKKGKLGLIYAEKFRYFDFLLYVSDYCSVISQF